MSITINAPAQAQIGLYAGVPEKRTYADSVKPEKAIAATAVATKDGITTYTYEGLEQGIYFYAAAQEGYNSICQTINHTGETRLESHNYTPIFISTEGQFRLLRLEEAIKAYEGGYIQRVSQSEYEKMLYARERIAARVVPEPESE
jgi:hypothetical protein